MAQAETAGGCAVRLVTTPGGPRFLGLAVGERNARVARRAMNGADPAFASSTRQTSTLIVPAGTAITAALFKLIPQGNWTIRWNGRTAHLATADPVALPRLTVDLPDDAVLDVSTAAARTRAEWRLLRASGKPTDGWLSRHVHRRISRIFSFLFLRLGLRADLATLLTFAVGVWGAWLLAQTSHATMIAGTLLFWFASIADGIDGEMARLTLSESSRGEQLDTAVDHATHLLGYAGVLVGWWRQGIGRAGAVLAVAVALGVPLVLLWTMRLVRSARGLHGQLFVDTKPIELGIAAAARQTGAPLLVLASWIFVLFRREVISLTFFLVSLATGWRGVYPTLIAGGLAVVAATLIGYRRTIAHTIAHL